MMNEYGLGIGILTREDQIRLEVFGNLIAHLEDVIRNCIKIIPFVL